MKKMEYRHNNTPSPNTITFMLIIEKPIIPSHDSFHFPHHWNHIGF
jgi:hypothetical protein